MAKTNKGPKALSDLLTLNAKPDRQSRPRAKRDTLHVIDGETGRPVNSRDVTGKTKEERDAIGREMMEPYGWDRYFTRLNDGRGD